MVDKIVMHSYSYLINSAYERISTGKFFDASFRTYEKDLVEKAIFYFEER